MKTCTKCKAVKPESEFGERNSARDGLNCWCKTCVNARSTIYRQTHQEKIKAYKAAWYKAHKPELIKRFTERRHESGYCRPIGESREASQWLGVHVAETVLSRYFEDIARMPYTNRGYDFICKNGFKIDAKSACLYESPGGGQSWNYIIRRNEIADYFICLAFDNRDDLTPMHVWLIPGNVINHLVSLGIYASQRGLAKWEKYEKPLDKAIECCAVMRSNDR